MILAKIVDPYGAGSYAAPLATPASLVSRSISLVLLPSLAAAYGRGDHEGVRAQVDTSTRALTVISVATFGPLMILSPLVIGLFFRRAGFEDAAPLLVLLLLAVLLLSVVIGPVNSLLTREHEQARIVMYSGLSSVGLGVLFWFATVPTLGVLGVALGYLVGTATMAVVPLVAAWRLDADAWAGLWNRFACGTGLAAALAVVALRLNVGALVDLALAAAFLLGWGLVSHRDVRLTARLLVSRG